MTAFIGVTATGDIPTGTVNYDTIFAVGALLFVMTLAMNAVGDPAGPPLPGGLRVSPADARGSAPSAPGWRAPAPRPA